MSCARRGKLRLCHPSSSSTFVGTLGGEHSELFTLATEVRQQVQVRVLMHKLCQVAKPLGVDSSMVPSSQRLSGVVTLPSYPLPGPYQHSSGAKMRPSGLFATMLLPMHSESLSLLYHLASQICTFFQLQAITSHHLPCVRYVIHMPPIFSQLSWE